MACCYCQKNDAVGRYINVKRGKQVEETYCLDCYEKFFLYATKKDVGEALSVCPYCNTTVEEFKKSKLVGCAKCYDTLTTAIEPVVIKMQGKRAHCGKTPILDLTFDEELGETREGKLKEALAEASWKRQCREIECLIPKLLAEKDGESAKLYADKLSQIRCNEKLEGGALWRGKLTARSKRQ